MAITNLVTNDSVRAVLGVSDLELTDAVLASPIYATKLAEDVYDLHAQMADDYTSVLAIDEAMRTSAQQRFVDLAQAYAAYQVAQQCLISLPLFSPLTIKDSKSEVTRSQKFYEQLKNDVGYALSVMRTRLLTIYPQINPDALVPAAVDRVFAAGVGIGTDPVTGS